MWRRAVSELTRPRGNDHLGTRVQPAWSCHGERPIYSLSIGLNGRASPINEKLRWGTIAFKGAEP